MRGHPLGGPLPLILRALLAGPLLTGCLASDSPIALAGSAGAAVVIATAPGETLAFVPAATTATIATSGSIVVSFRNQSSLAHNLVFTSPLSAATRTIVEPGTGDELLLADVAPGAYPFVCTIHLGMAGVLTVRASG